MSSAKVKRPELYGAADGYPYNDFRHDRVECGKKTRIWILAKFGELVVTADGHLVLPGISMLFVLPEIYNVENEPDQERIGKFRSVGTRQPAGRW